MNVVLQLIICIYLLFIVPFCFGIMGTVISRTPVKSVSVIFTNGYLEMAAMFCIVSVVVIQLKQPLSVLTHIWLLTTLLIVVFSALFGRRQIGWFLKEIKNFWIHGDTGKTCRREKYILLLLVAASIVLSIGFTRPYATDQTVEILNISLLTDSMYEYDAYTGYLSKAASTGHRFSPIEMLYAVAADITEMQSGLLVYYILPFFLLLLFFAGLWRLGGQLFDKEEHIAVFIGIAAAIYWMTTWIEDQSMVTGIFINCWNGITLLSCVILPIVLAVCLEWLDRPEKEGKLLWDGLKKAGMSCVLILAGQLAYAKGGFYVLLMIFLSLAAAVVRKGYEYGVSTGHLKKRI